MPNFYSIYPDNYTDICFVIQIAKYVLNNSELRDLENINTKNGLNHDADKKIAKYVLNNSELRDLENTNTKNGLNHAADKKMSPFLINMYKNTK